MGGVAFGAGEAAIFGEARDIVFALWAGAAFVVLGHAGEDEAEDHDEDRVGIQDRPHDRQVDCAVVVGVEPVVHEADGDEDGDGAEPPDHCPPCAAVDVEARPDDRGECQE